MHDKTILIADNSIINRMQMGGILASEYNILEADNGHDALDIMRERGEDGIDAVLLDLHMPGQTGFDVLAEKQANPAIADIPVIVITADSVTAAEVHALDAGAADFLTKPIEPEIMRRRVSLVINARELEEQRMRVRMLEEAAWITDHDDLTGLYTRKAFLREMQGMIDTHPDQEYLLAVWDFENFKTFNELFGTALHWVIRCSSPPLVAWTTCLPVVACTDASETTTSSFASGKAMPTSSRSWRAS